MAFSVQAPRLAYKLKLQKWEGGHTYDTFNPPRKLGEGRDDDVLGAGAQKG